MFDLGTDEFGHMILAISDSSPGNDMVQVRVNLIRRFSNFLLPQFVFCFSISETCRQVELLAGLTWFA